MNDHAPRFQDVLTLLGQLNYTWTNTESLLIHLIAGLARIDKETAIIIFLTLNTPRARVDLVERLAKMNKTDKKLRIEILNVTQRLMTESRLRNKYNHCIYSFDEHGEKASTLLMRIFDGKNEIKYGKLDLIDNDEIENIKGSIKNITDVNREIWRISKEHQFPL